MQPLAHYGGPGSAPSHCLETHMATKPVTARPPRFERRFNNGVYHLFDVVKYEPIGASGLRKQADERVAGLNRGRK